MRDGVVSRELRSDRLEGGPGSVVAGAALSGGLAGRGMERVTARTPFRDRRGLTPRFEAVRTHTTFPVKSTVERPAEEWTYRTRCGEPVASSVTGHDAKNRRFEVGDHTRFPVKPEDGVGGFLGGGVRSGEESFAFTSGHRISDEAVRRVDERSDTRRVLKKDRFRTPTRRTFRSEL